MDGTAAEGLKLKNYPQRLLQTVSLTWSKRFRWDPPWCGEVVGQLRWQSLAVTERLAQRLHLHLGSRLVLTSNGRTIQANVLPSSGTMASMCSRAASSS